jgi:hypothetical protein
MVEDGSTSSAKRRTRSRLTDELAASSPGSSPALTSLTIAAAARERAVV